MLRALRQIVRRGLAAAAPEGRRLVLLQIDGLSSRRLRVALDGGFMPRLAERLAAGTFVLRRLRTTTAPSTAAHQAALLYGTTRGIPGFAWYDRALGRALRMDLAVDVALVEAELARSGAGLLAGGVSYGALFVGGARSAFFNLVRHTFGAGASVSRRNLFDHLASLWTAALVAARLLHRAAALARRPPTLRYFVSVLSRDVAAHGAALDVLRGVPVVYADFFGYDEAAHRAGPDSRAALEELRAIDDAVAQVLHAVDAAPEYRYDVYLFSDHGHSATVPFRGVTGEDLPTWVRRRAAAARVVSGGTIAHVVLEPGGPLRFGAIARRWRGLLAALADCPAVGYVIVRSGRSGRSGRGFRPVVLRRGRRLGPGELRGLDPLVSRHLARAVASPRAGDLVLLGAGARAGNVSFDDEPGSHGGVHPDELDCFLLHPAAVAAPVRATAGAEDLYRFFRSVYLRKRNAHRNAAG